MEKRLVALVFACAIPLAWAAAPVSTGIPELRGEVLEVLDVEAYTYLRLKTAAGEVWAAVSRAPVRKGSQVTVFDPAEMRNFESRALKRTFPTIYFGTVGTAATEGDPPQVHGGVPRAAAGEDVKIAKAEGTNGRTIAQINSDRDALKDKPVKVRAKVAKVTPNVMGMNWVHLRDGSGSATDGSNAILVTSKSEPKVGDIVVATGVVRTDVNLGSGYVYKVLVENASLSK